MEDAGADTVECGYEATEGEGEAVLSCREEGGRMREGGSDIGCCAACSSL